MFVLPLFYSWVWVFFPFSFGGQVVVVVELKGGTGSVGLHFLSGFSPNSIPDSDSEANNVMSLFFGPISDNHLMSQMATLCLQCSHCGGLWGAGGVVILKIHIKKTHQLIKHVHYTIGVVFIWGITNYSVIICCVLGKAFQMHSLKKHSRRAILLTLVSVLLNQGVSKQCKKE